MWAIGNRYHHQVGEGQPQKGGQDMFQVAGGHHSLAGIPGGGFQRGTDFQPPYFPPPFSHQGMEVFGPIQVILTFDH